MHSLLLALVLMSSIIGSNSLPNEDAPIRISETFVSSSFGRQIEIQAVALTGDPLTDGQVFFQVEGSQPIIVPAKTTSAGRIKGVLDVSQYALLPFQRVYYWFRLHTPSVPEYISPAFYFDYKDERYNWQHVQDAAFRLHWYQGDMKFGQQILTTAHRGLESIQRLLPLEMKTPIDITVYASQEDFRSGGQTTGTLASQNFSGPTPRGLIIISPKGSQQQAYLERELPNQLMQVILQQSSGANFGLIPAWLVEGLATLAELQGNSDNQIILENARQQRSLGSIDELCAALQKEPTSLSIALAESASFTRFLYNSYGSGALLRLLQAYQSGLGCSDAVQSVYSVSLDQMDARWRDQALGIRPVYQAARQLSPYILLFGLIIVIPLLSTAGFLNWKLQNDSGDSI